MDRGTEEVDSERAMGEKMSDLECELSVTVQRDEDGKILSCMQEWTRLQG